MTVKEKKKEKVVYIKVWEMPVRFVHWMTFLSVITLGISGYYIGNPSFSMPAEASASHTVGNIRFIHFSAGFLLISCFLIRLYWGFVGNRFSRWLTMLPHTKERWKGIFWEIEDLLKPRGRLRIYTGHSPAANMIYLFVYLGIFFAILTGLTLYSQSHYSPLWRQIAYFGIWLFGDLNTVHFLHRLMLWFFALMVLLHLYFVIYTVVVSRTTEIDTMFSGMKFVFESELAKETEGKK